MYLLTLSDLTQTIHTNPLQEPPLVPSYLQERLQLLVKQILMGLPVAPIPAVGFPAPRTSAITVFTAAKTVC
jgi:hypothetical protein